MAQPRAVIDVVGAERRPHHLLEEIGLLVAAFRGPEPGQRLRSMLCLDGEQLRCDQIEGFLVARALAPFREDDFVVLHVVRRGTADAAIRTERIDRLQFRSRHERQRNGLVGEGSGGARGDAFAARNAGRFPHRVIEVEADPRGVALARAADDFVALDVVAGTDAAIAEDACLMIEWLFQDTSQG